MTIRAGGEFLIQYSGKNAPVKIHMPGVMEFIIDLPKTNYCNRPLEYQDLLYEVSCASKTVASRISLVELYLPTRCSYRMLEDYKKARQASKCKFFNL
jgi:hypothetical protein